eukprot:TRINITY_DN67256_c1_g3_i10.p1 TRINITY_DN67256_c1_g3~~TRINITY_DN67256_c1_g3_i10.p1  ORF type:complete len:104 (-),score=2.53 TRINITY_DN67256_c1_g3_i10:170-481(-)
MFEVVTDQSLRVLMDQNSALDTGRLHGHSRGYLTRNMHSHTPLTNAYNPEAQMGVFGVLQTSSMEIHMPTQHGHRPRLATPSFYVVLVVPQQPAYGADLMATQ